MGDTEKRLIMENTESNSILPQLNKQVEQMLISACQKSNYTTVVILRSA